MRCQACSPSLIARFFLFSRAAPPRALHSFPTRRSSDLLGTFRLRLLNNRREPEPHAGGPAPRSDADAPGRPRAARSEEHTSELQSRSDLVCRLLLEKKKKSLGSGLVSSYGSQDYLDARI